METADKDKMAQQQTDPTNKADNQSVYDKPAIEKKTNDGEAEKCDNEGGNSYTNTIKRNPDMDTTNGVDKV